MAVGSMEIKQVQKTISNDAVSEQCRLKECIHPQGKGATPYTVGLQYSGVPVPEIEQVISKHH